MDTSKNPYFYLLQLSAGCFGRGGGRFSWETRTDMDRQGRKKVDKDWWPETMSSSFRELHIGWMSELW